MEHKSTCRGCRLCYNGPMHPPDFHSEQLLSDWPECHLEMSCGCGRSTHPAMKLLVQQFGDLPFHSLLPRLRCEKCGGKFGPVFLVAGQTRLFCGGHPGAWAIEIVPNPAWRTAHMAGG